MASLLDLYQNPGGAPMSWQMAPLQQNEAQIGAELGEGMRRLQRNFSEYDLPDLVNSQAARGAFFSSATQNKAKRLQTGMVEGGADMTRRAGISLGDLAQRKVGVTTGAGF